ncbi:MULTISPECIES: hypothetical protein [Brevibacterium]|uniref:Uncharacterized protein n=2 Tax=Brevibacterium TaxID=1696 RepID=A0A1H1T5S3_BRESA|nr:hypothetical protein [Brevibacterium sandarakinum]SDS55540.1 hypothetical protein SAMN04489751_2282 [Brevibacterium sandarakinum]
MRYLVAFIIGIGALFGVNAFIGIFSMPRPWNSLSMGATVGITMVVVLLIWEVVKPSNKDAAPAKPAMSEEERANARAERRSRLAAEAGVRLDDTESGDTATTDTTTTADTADTDGTRSTSTSSAGDDGDSTSDAVDSNDDVSPDSHASPRSDESSIEADPNDSDTGQDEPDTLAPDEFDEEATGSSLENPPTGEPGVSVDALEDAEEAGTDDAAADGTPDNNPVDDDGHADREPTTDEPDSKH